MSWLLHDEAETMALGGQLFQAMSDGALIFLDGNLGAGKTTLVRGWLREAGYQGVVKSPTYTLLEEYRINGRTTYHFDLYRLADPEELEWIGIRDFLQQEQTVFIEWAQRGAGLLPLPDICFALEIVQEGRIATIDCNSERGKLIEKKLVNSLA